MLRGDINDQCLVLVVEDNPLLQMTTVDILADAGLSAVSVSNADEAIDFLERRSGVDALFSDIDMPGSMDGIQLAAAVGQRWPGIRTVLTSGGPCPDDWTLPPHVLFYQKPYDRQSVVDALRG